jgi:hypothetical protein
MGWRRRAEHVNGKLSSRMTDLRSENITSLDNLGAVSHGFLIKILAVNFLVISYCSLAIQKNQ